MTISELTTYTDTQLRILFSLIRAFVCSAPTDYDEFTDDIKWDLENRDFSHLSDRKAVIGVWLALEELKMECTNTVIHDHVESNGETIFDVSSTKVFNEALYTCTIEGFKTTIS